MATLNLDTLKRDTISFNGEEYELKAPCEFSLAEQQKRIELARKAKKLQKKKITEKSMQLMCSYQDEIINMILLAPHEIKKKLTIAHKIQIINFFLEREKIRKQTGIQTPNTDL